MECLQMFGSLNMGKYQWMTPIVNSNLTFEHCLPVDIPMSTSWVEATTIVPIKGSMPLLQLQHSTTSLCWQACSTITDWQWLWYIRCCSIQANHCLSQPWHLSYSMITTTLAWKQDKQVVISSVGGSCWYVLEGGLWGYDTEPMMGWQLRHSNWNKSLLREKLDKWLQGENTINVEMSHNIRIRMMHSFEWDMLESIPKYNADLWNLPAQMTLTISLSQNKMHCSSKQQQHVSQCYPHSISIWYLSDCIAECHWTGWKVGCEIGNVSMHFVQEKLIKTVQFMQPNNDDMMKKVYVMAWK
jgi:hypothetical protein